MQRRKKIELKKNKRKMIEGRGEEGRRKKKLKIKRKEKKKMGGGGELNHQFLLGKTMP